MNHQTWRIEVKVKSVKTCKESRENNSADLSALKSKWPSTVVARKKFREFSGGLVSPGTVANADCVGEGPEGAFMIGRNVGYPVDCAIAWLEKRVVKDAPHAPPGPRNRRRKES